MSSEADREGSFKAQIIDYGMKKAESGAIAVTLKVKLMAMWDPETQSWLPWSDYDMEAWGDLYVVKKDSTLNETACKSLINCAGWDGYLESICDKTWQPQDCQVVLQANEYKGVTTYRVGFLNALDRTPGAMMTLDKESVKQLSAQYGAPLRALAGSAKAAATPKPNGKPAAPPKAKAKPAPVAAGVGAESGNAIDPVTGKEVPF